MEVRDGLFMICTFFGPLGFYATISKENTVEKQLVNHAKYLSKVNDCYVEEMKKHRININDLSQASTMVFKMNLQPQYFKVIEALKDIIKGGSNECI